MLAGDILPIERAVIGCVLLEGLRALPPLLAEEFFAGGHQMIWSAMLEQAHAHGRVDVLGVRYALQQGTGWQADMDALLAHCYEDACFGGPHLGRYASLVRGAARDRMTRQLGMDLAAQGFGEAEVLRRLAELPGPLAAPMFDPADNWGRIVASWNTGRIMTGFAGLDRLTAGLTTSDFIVVGGRTSHGKALALDTPLPTPSGWTTMGEVRAGDYLLGADGRPVLVRRTSDVQRDRRCYAVTFSDGTVIVADGEHRWPTRTRASRRSKARAVGVVTTESLASTHHLVHAVPVCAPLCLPAALLPIPPYTLGAWLGDGHTHSAQLTCVDLNIVAEIELEGVSVHPTTCRNRAQQWRLGGRRGKGGNPASLQTRLRVMGLLGKKHIPDAYLRASEDQRRALLAGLLDTDGTVNNDGSVGLDLTSAILAQGARELLCTLGYRPAMSKRVVRGARPESSICYRIRVVTDDKVFRLRRKAETLMNRRAGRWVQGRVSHWGVRTVDAVPSVPVKCVEVNAADGLYLAGRSCIPTHNTSFLTALALRLVLNGVSVEYLTLEDSPDAITRRMVACLTGISTLRLKDGAVSEREFHEAEQAVRQIQHLPLTITGVDHLRSIDESAVVPQVGRSTATVIIVDHLQQITTKDPRRVDGLERVVKRFQSLALRDGKVLFLAAQLNREVEARQGPPRLSDLRDCGAVEQAARQVWLLYWPCKHDANRPAEDYELYLAKHADGGTDLVPLRFESWCGRFADP